MTLTNRQDDFNQIIKFYLAGHGSYLPENRSVDRARLARQAFFMCNIKALLRLSDIQLNGNYADAKSRKAVTGG
jgi:hypothetical protein